MFTAQLPKFVAHPSATVTCNIETEINESVTNNDDEQQKTKRKFKMQVFKNATDELE